MANAKTGIWSAIGAVVGGAAGAAAGHYAAKARRSIGTQMRRAGATSRTRWSLVARSGRSPERSSLAR